MRRAHRSVHLLLWLALAPAVAAAFLFALANRPEEPVSETPEDVVTEAP